MIRACVGHARLMMYRGGACAGSNGVCLHVVHEFVLLKVSVREHRARLECCVDGYERF